MQLRLNTPVTLRRYSKGQLAIGKILGQISAVGYGAATFTTVEVRTDSKWPKNQDLMPPTMPVCLALTGSFESDPGHTLAPLNDGFWMMRNAHTGETRYFRSGDRCAVCNPAANPALMEPTTAVDCKHWVKAASDLEQF